MVRWPNLPRTAPRWILAGALACALAGFFGACDLTAGKPAAKQYFSLLVPDSLSLYDTVRVLLMEANSADTLETLWDGPLPDPAALHKLPSREYKGGDVDLYIEGRKSGIRYRLLVRYRGADAKPVTIPLAIPVPNQVTDTIPPSLFKSGPDTLISFLDKPFRDSSVLCLDDSNPRLPVSVTGTVDTADLGIYTLIYHCQDLAGNQAVEKERFVKVVRVPDTDPPSILLSGPGFIGIVVHQPFVDSAATCVDGRDGSLAVKVSGSVDVSVPGNYTLKYDCTDSAGNRAPEKIRTVQVIAAVDSTLPVLIFNDAGHEKDTLAAVLGTPFQAPGAGCIDAQNGTLKVTINSTVDVNTLGLYSVKYSCSDSSGNIATATRIVRVMPVTVVRAQQETTIDTNDLVRDPNQGYTGVLPFTAYPKDHFLTFVKFDLAKVRKPGLKSAKIRFHTFGTGTGWDSSPLALTFRVSALKSVWVEGTGNWYFSDGVWLNGGDALYVNYGIPDSVRLHSTDALSPSGLAPDDKAIGRSGNLTFLSSQKATLAYSAKHGTGPVPAPADLVVLDLNLTNYVETTDPAKDFGFLITVEGIPAGKSIAFLTKEIGDGSYAPELFLSY